MLEAPSDAELVVLRLLVTGLSIGQVAQRLFLSPNTVRSHTRVVYRKLGVHSRADLVARATELGLLQQPIHPVNELAASAPSLPGAILPTVTIRAYRLIVAGELSEPLAATFGGMTCRPLDGTSVLTGPIRDQAELQGLLAHIAALGLTLLEVRTTDSDTASANSR